MSQTPLDLSLDDIIKENKAKQRKGSNTRGRGRGAIRGGGRGRGVSRGGVAKRAPDGRGNARGGGNTTRGRGITTRGRGITTRGRGITTRGRGNTRGRGITRSQSKTRFDSTNNAFQQNRPSRSQRRSQNFNTNNPLMRERSISTDRSNNQQNFIRQRSRSRSRSRARFNQSNNQQNARSRSRSRSRSRNQFQQNARSRSRSRSQNRINTQMVNIQTRSRTPVRGGITARLGNRGQKRVYGKGGLRSDMILASQNEIRSRTFSRSNSVPRIQNSYTMSVANDGFRNVPSNRRNSINNGDGFQQSNVITRMRGRGRGRGAANGRIKFINRQILDPEIQRAIAEMQGKVYKNGKIIESNIDVPGINFFATPQTTMTKLSDRFTNL